jgi:hypothetical protein
LGLAEKLYPFFRGHNISCFLQKHSPATVVRAGHPSSMKAIGQVICLLQKGFNRYNPTVAGFIRRREGWLCI